MATASEMKAGLDDIASIIRSQRDNMKEVKSTASSVSAELAGITTKYADVIATIDAIPANTTDNFERVVKAEKAKLAAEFTALKTKADTVAAMDMTV